MVGRCQPHPGQPWVGDCHPVAGCFQPHRDPFVGKGTSTRALRPAVPGTSPAPLSHPQEGAGAAPLQLRRLRGCRRAQDPRVGARRSRTSPPAPNKPLWLPFQAPAPNPVWNLKPAKSLLGLAAASSIPLQPLCPCGGSWAVPQPQGRENCSWGPQNPPVTPPGGSHCDTAPARAALTD